MFDIYKSYSDEKYKKLVEEHNNSFFGSLMPMETLEKKKAREKREKEIRDFITIICD